MWGYSRLHYLQSVTSHLGAKGKKALMRELLTTNIVRKYARKARDYKLRYHGYILDITKAQDASAGNFCIEHITKLVKNHRYALDSDTASLPTLNVTIEESLIRP